MTGWNMSIVKKLLIPVPPLDEQKEFERRLLELRDVSSFVETNTQLFAIFSTSLKHSAFKGELTQQWREIHRSELEDSLNKTLAKLPSKAVRVSFTEVAPAERPIPSRPARHWLMNQLSTVQSQVYDALGEWKGTLIPTEYLDRFLEQWPIDHLKDCHDQVLRALNQLSGLGLVARVNIPNQLGEYVSGYRILREDELSLHDDLEELGKPV